MYLLKISNHPLNLKFRAIDPRLFHWLEGNQIRSDAHIDRNSVTLTGYYCLLSILKTGVLHLETLRRGKFSISMHLTEAFSKFSKNAALHTKHIWWLNLTPLSKRIKYMMFQIQLIINYNVAREDWTFPSPKKISKTHILIIQKSEIQHFVTSLSIHMFQFFYEVVQFKILYPLRSLLWEN